MHKRTAFTIIELLVVISLLALLIAMLMPAIRRAKEIGLQIQCTNNCRQIGSATHVYSEDSVGATPILNNPNFPFTTVWSVSVDNNFEARGVAALIEYLGGSEAVDLRMRQDAPYQYALPSRSVWETVLLCPVWAPAIEPVTYSEHYYYWKFPFGTGRDEWFATVSYAQFCGIDEDSPFTARGTSTTLSRLSPRFPIFADIAWLNGPGNWVNVTYTHNDRIKRFDGMNASRADGSADWIGVGSDPQDVYESHQSGQGRWELYPRDY